jgi:hypothetical protein
VSGVLGLAGQAAEEVADELGGQAQPAASVVAAQEYLGDGDADEFGVGEQGRASRTGAVFGRRDHVVVQMDVECCQKGVKVSLHTPILDALRRARRRFRDFPSTI